MITQLPLILLRFLHQVQRWNAVQICVLYALVLQLHIVAKLL